MDKTAQMTIALLLKKEKYAKSAFCELRRSDPSALVDMPFEHYRCLCSPSCAQMSSLTKTGSFLAASSYTPTVARDRARLSFTRTIWNHAVPYRTVWHGCLFRASTVGFSTAQHGHTVILACCAEPYRVRTVLGCPCERRIRCVSLSESICNCLSYSA